MGVRQGQARIRAIAGLIAEGSPLSEDDKAFLVAALIDISNGEEAEVALNVKAKPGERKSKNQRLRDFNDPFMYGFIATAIAPEHDGGLGMTVKDAVTIVKKEFPNLPTEESIKRMWNTIKDSNPREFYVKSD